MTVQLILAFQMILHCCRNRIFRHAYSGANSRYCRNNGLDTVFLEETYTGAIE